MAETVFHKILAGDIPAKIRYENEHVLAFDDINPSAKTHVLVIPKKHIPTLADVQTEEDKKYVAEIFAAIQEMVKKFDLTKGYYIRVNAGNYQEVPYLHFHLMSDVKELD